MLLTELDPEVPARLKALRGDRSFKRRLMELGFLPNAPLLVVRRVPLGGLIEVEVRKCRVTLRLSEASEVEVAIG